MQPTITRKVKSEIVVIGDPEIGEIHVEKRGSISVGERMQIDEAGTNKDQGRILWAKLADRVSKDRGISVEAAEDLIRGQITVEAENGQPSNTTVANNEHIKFIAEYAKDYYELSSVFALIGISNIVVTVDVFIKARGLVRVHLESDAKINATTLDIEPASIYLNNKQRIRFGSQIVVVNANHDMEADTIKVNKIAEPIAAQTIGYLLAENSRSLLTGFAAWKLEDTKGLSESLVSEIYEFYQSEAAGWVKTEPQADPADDGEQVGESLQLTGSPSTGESSPIELVTDDSEIGTPTSSNPIM